MLSALTYVATQAREAHFCLLLGNDGCHDNESQNLYFVGIFVDSTVFEVLRGTSVACSTLRLSLVYEAVIIGSEL